MTFTVPSTYIADQYDGNDGYTAGENVVPTAMIPCLQVYSIVNGVNDGGNAWFANIQLTITT
jgi:hypothetical protein